MKLAKYLLAVAAVLLLLPFAAFAAEGHTSFTITSPARIGTKTLQPGRYKLEWNGQGKNVSLDIMKSGKTVATANGKMVQQKTKAPYNAVDINTASKTSVIDGFYFHNQRNELVVRKS